MLQSPKRDLVKKGEFSSNYRSLKIIWRSFGDSKLKSHKRNRIPNEETYYMPKSEVW